MISRVALPNNGQTYRFGFNGKENDNGVKGLGNQQDYGMRIYDPRVGRFLSVDPLTKKYAELTPYQYASNRPIEGIDLDGMEFTRFFMPSSSGTGLGINMAWMFSSIAESKKNQAHGLIDPGWTYHYQKKLVTVGASSLIIGATIYGGNYIASNFWSILPQLIYNPVVHTEIIGGLAALAGYNGPDIPSPGQKVEATFRRTWEEWAITSTKGGKDVISQELKATATLIMHSGSSFANEGEKKIAQKLLSEGNTVEVLAESTIQHVQTPDFKVNGILTELKTLSNIVAKEPVKLADKIAQRIKQSSGQGTSLILDVTGQEGANLEVVQHALKKYWGQGQSKTDIRVIGNGFDKSYKRTDFYPNN
jgi:RHS repeat-associated protein